MAFESYKFTFRMNASHANVKTDEGIHSHTFEISLFIKQNDDSFVAYDVTENIIQEYLKPYSGVILNSVPPFNVISPTIENIGEEFFTQITLLLANYGYQLLKLDISESPQRIFSISEEDLSEQERERLHLSISRIQKAVFPEKSHSENDSREAPEHAEPIDFAKRDELSEPQKLACANFVPIKYALIIIAAIQLIMIVVNGYAYVSVYKFDDHSTEGYYSFVKPMIDRVNEYDSGLFRTEKSFFNTNNDAMMMSYNGFSHFSSADKYFVRNFMADLGYNKNYFWIYYDKGATIAADSLLGMKYFLSKDPYDYFKVIDTVNNTKIYENPYALPVGFLSDTGILDLKLDHEAPFSNQQRIYNALLGDEVNFFNIYDNYSMDVSDNLTWDIQEDGSNMFVRESEDEEGIITIRFTAIDNNPTFLFLSSVYEPNVIVLVNGENLGSYLSTYHQGVLPIGSFESGSEVEIKVSLVKLNAGFENPQIASIDMDRFAEVSQRLQQGGWNILEHDSMHINAEIFAENDKLVFTSIPYIDGWKVYVDGVETTTLKVCDTLLAFPVQQGNHLIEMKFEVKGAKLGIILSMAGVLLFVITIWGEKRSSNTKKE